MTRPTVLVTGATGTVGSHLIPALQERGAHVRAMIRDPERPVPGIENVVADLRDPGAVAAALEGVDTAFLNSPSEEEAARLQIRFADLAHKGGVNRLVLLSQFAAHVESPVRFLRWHAEVEEHVRGLGIDHTVLRPNLYMQALLGFSGAIAQGVLGAPIGEATVSLIDTRDVADAAAVVSTDPGHGGRTYTLTGPRSLTHEQVAQELSRALGWEVAFVEVSAERFRAELTGSVPPWPLEGLIEDYAHYARGEAAEVHTAVSDLTGRPARDIADFAREHAGAFTRA